MGGREFAQGLVELAKSKPEALTYASAGPGSGLTLLGALFKNVAGIAMLEVPYKSFGAILLVAGTPQAIVRQLRHLLP
ncbi:MAG: hypothetical protein EXR28_04100 [Betaproteobacteria bacterium]|nr:hypothetical protein [Betaproteobacteria bacterium]